MPPTTKPAAIAIATLLAACGHATPASSPPDAATDTSVADTSVADTSVAADAGDASSGGDAADAGGTSITLGPAQQLLQPGDLGLRSVPDVQLSLLRQADASYRVWIGGSIGTSNGSVGLLSTTDFDKYTPVVGDGGSATPVFGASAPTPCGSGVPGSPAFDAQYAATGTVFPAANGADLLMIYHAENHTFAGSCYKTLPFYATLGLARSTDGGETWSRQGAIVTGRDPQPATAPSMNAGWGAAVPSAIVAGGYTYVFYSDYPVPGGGHDVSNSIMVARAPASSDGAPGSWQKWLGGSFSSPGTGGNSTAILPITGSTCVFPRQPGISFNAHLQKYLLTMVCGAGWFFSVASDLTTQSWSPPVEFFAAPFDNQSLQPGNEYDWHLALVTPGQPSGQSTDKTGFVLWSRGGYPNTPIHMLWRQTFTINP